MFIEYSVLLLRVFKQYTVYTSAFQPFFTQCPFLDFQKFSPPPNKFKKKNTV